MGNKRACILVGAVLFVLTSLVQAQNAVQKYWSDNYGVSMNMPDGKFYQYSRLAKAQPDECFDATNLNASYNSFFLTYPNNLDLTNVVNGACTNSLTSNPGQLKTNQSYLWGFTSWGHDLWFGTIANTLCLVADALGGSNLITNTVECQGLVKDARPPRMFLYDTKTAQLIDMTPQVFNSANPVDKFNLMHTTGLRSAGSLGDVVFLAGIAQSGITMFAFNGRTRTFIGSIYYNGTGGLPQYGNIRQWLTTNNTLYVGVAGPATGSIGGFGSSTGYILRWKGTTSSPFQFDTVAVLNADPAYLARYQDKLFVMTWGGPPDSFGTQLFMSPGISKISTATANSWQRVWKYADYEVEPSAAMGGGALAEHDGWLYWSTMVPPGVQALSFSQMYPAASAGEGFLGSYRPTTLFRGKFLDTKSPTLQVLYGNALLPKFVNQGTDTKCSSDGTGCQWTIAANKMGGAPGVFGHAGYNNPFNSYTWWMSEYNGELFIGTFDWSYLLGETLFDQYAGQIPPGIIAAAREFEGADLLRIHSSNDPAYIVDLDGVGNFSNYGVRNMLQLGSELYIGTANPFNLLNPPTSANYQDQLGGWELLHLKPTGLWYQTYCTMDPTIMPSYCLPPTTP